MRRGWVRTTLPHRTLAGDGYWTRTQLVATAQGLPDTLYAAPKLFLHLLFSCTVLENYLKNLLD